MPLGHEGLMFWQEQAESGQTAVERNVLESGH